MFSNTGKIISFYFIHKGYIFQGNQILNYSIAFAYILLILLLLVLQMFLAKRVRIKAEWQLQKANPLYLSLIIILDFIASQIDALLIMHLFYY